VREGDVGEGVMPSIDALVAEVEREGFIFPPGRISRGEFGDSKQLSNHLLFLIRSGGKRATTGLLWEFEAEGEPLPDVGDIEIAVNDAGQPAVVLRFTAVDVLAFDEVTSEFAAREGEGDLSLAWWREAHWDFFSRLCAHLGRAAAADMPVVCLDFEVLHVCRGCPGSPSSLAV
jgi:uncharacterized protein YhfF